MRDYLLGALATLFVTIDPVGLAPVFVVLTAGQPTHIRRRTGLRAAVIAGAVLVSFAVAGEQLIGFLGISVNSFRIAGGLLLFAVAFDMVFGRGTWRRAVTARTANDEEHHDVAAFPLGVPLIAGPASISATILLASHSQGVGGLAGLLLIILLLVGVCLLVFQAADRIESAMGETGRSVVTRLLGVLLAALSVQFVADGVLLLAGAKPA
ncbi:MAG: MarC family protein [Bauldia sp.]